MPIGEWNDFKTYAWSSGFWVKKGEKKLGRNTTHLLLDGGMLEVPPEKEQEFLDAYARSFLMGLDLYVVDDRHGELVPIGRPWLTLMVDHYSRLPVGYYLGFKPPGFESVALALR